MLRYILRSIVTTKIFPGTMDVRKVQKMVLSVEQAEGVGARVRRSIGRREVSSSTVLQFAENALNST